MNTEQIQTVPTIAQLQEALEYDPSNKKRPLICKVDFAGYKAGQRLGFKKKDVQVVTFGRINVPLRNLVWRCMEGYIPPKHKVIACHSPYDNRIVNLRLQGIKANRIVWTYPNKWETEKALARYVRLQGIPADNKEEA